MSATRGVEIVCQTTAVMDNFIQKAAIMYGLTRSEQEVKIKTQFEKATTAANAVTNGFLAVKAAQADFAIMPAMATLATVRTHATANSETARTECNSRGFVVSLSVLSV